MTKGERHTEMLMRTIRLWFAVVATAIFICILSGCSGAASAPSGGTSTLVPIELSSLNFPESMPMGIGEIAGGAGSIARADDDDDDDTPNMSLSKSSSFDELSVPAQATYWADLANDQFDAILGFLGEADIPVSESTTSYTGATPDGATLTIDFSAFTLPEMTLDSEINCSATCSGHTASAPVCGVAKVDGKRMFMFLIHEFPSGSSKGKGCFRTVTDFSDRSSELALLTGEEDFLLTGAYDHTTDSDQELEIFWHTDVADAEGNRIKNAHAYIVKATDSETSDVVTTMSLEGTTSEFGTEADLSFQGAWVAGSDRLKTTLEVDGTTMSDSCVDFAGTTATGCVSTELPDLVGEAVEDDYTTETTVASSTGIVGGGMAAGESYTIVIDADGTGRAWGKNSDGQLGNGGDDDSSTPVVISSLEGIEAFSGGLNHSLAVVKDATTGVKHAWGWGSNLVGQIGDGTSNNRRADPVKIDSLSNVVDVIAGASKSFFILEDGTVYATGNNSSGDLGDGTTTDRTTPVRVTGDLSNVIALDASNHIVALRSDGTVFGWGYSISGRLGTETQGAITEPIELPFENVKAVATNTDATYALLEDGTIEAVGTGYLGNGAWVIDRIDPVTVSNLTDVVAIAANANHAYALKDDGTVWSWGVNDLGINGSGTLGDGTTTTRATPVQVSGLTDIVAIEAGFNHGIAVKRDGTVWAWGTNANGQLGDGTTTTRLTPVQVQGLDTAE